MFFTNPFIEKGAATSETLLSYKCGANTYLRTWYTPCPCCTQNQAHFDNNISQFQKMTNGRNNMSGAICVPFRSIL